MGLRTFPHVAELVAKSRAALWPKQSQNDVAIALGLANGNYISHIESGLRSVPDAHVRAYADVLGVTCHAILDAKIMDIKLYYAELLAGEYDS